MSLKQLKNFINGEYVEAKSGKSEDLIDPANAQVYARSSVSGAEDIDAAYEEAADTDV